MAAWIGGWILLMTVSCSSCWSAGVVLCKNNYRHYNLNTCWLQPGNHSRSLVGSALNGGISQILCCCFEGNAVLLDGGSYLEGAIACKEEISAGGNSE